MRRMLIWVLSAMLLATACTTAVEQRADIRRLTELCGHVNLALTGFKPVVDPERFAEQFTDLVDDIRELDVPRQDPEQRERLVASFEEVSRRFTEAAAAKRQGDAELTKAEADLAMQRLRRTSELATEYGMPPLDQCDEEATLAPRDPAGPSETDAPPTPPTPSESESDGEALSWRRLADLDFVRQQSAAAEVDGAIYIAGGLVRRDPTADVAVLDTTVDQWRPAPPLPFPVHHEMAVNYGGKLVVLGGWRADDGNPTARVSDRVFILQSDGWKRLPPLRRARAAGAAAVVDGQIIVVGGQNDDGLVAPTEIFDGERWHDAAPIRSPREHLALAADGRYVYAVGGRDHSTDTNVATLERYDPDRDTWTELPPMSGPRGSINAAVVDGRLIVAGGEAPRSPLPTVEAYDIRAGSWSDLPDLEVARHGASVVGARGRVYVIGGAEAIGHARSSAVVEVLDLPPRPKQPTAWRDGGSARVARQQSAIARDDGSLWIIGGLDADNEATPSVQGFDPRFGYWRNGVDLPKPLHHAMAVNLGGALVVIGGWAPVGGELTGEVSGDVYILRDGADGWEQLAPLGHPRAAGAAGVVDGEIVVAGGRDRDGLVRPTEIYDADANVWRIGTDIPTAREHLAAAAIDGYLYAAGGRAASPTANTDALERYDPRSDEWEARAPMLTARGSIAATAVQGRLVVVGGETNDSVLPTVELYDVATDTWARGPDLLTPRHGAAVGVRGTTMYVIGGATRTLHRETSRSVEILDFR